jgi:putative peptidoglycan lipid II flippase
MSLLRAAATVGGYTMVSRLLGFVRDSLIAWALGAGGTSDAFFVALRLPNMFRTLFAEGAFSTAFVPVFAGRIAAEGRESARRYAEEAMALLLVVLIVFTILAEFFMPWLIPVLAAGFDGNAAEMGLTTHLTRIMFPYLLFISLATLQGGILNSLGRFAATAATPVLLNVFQIVAIIWSTRFGGTTDALSWAVTAAGVAQCLWLMGSCARAGMGLGLRLPRLTPEMRHLIGLMIPGIFGAGVTQINLMISTNFASFEGTGAISWLQYADRINQLPLALIGTAVGTAILPSLARAIRLGDERSAAEMQNRGIEMALFLTLPAAAALAVVGEPILAVLFQHGEFGPTATHQTAMALSVYALGLPAFVAIKVLVPGFYARQDTKTPVRLAIVSLLVNIILLFVLAGPLRHVGNATATTVAGWANALGLAWVLHRQGHLRLDARNRARLPRILLASLAMAALVALVAPAIGPMLSHGSIPRRGLGLAGLVGLGMVSYAAFVLGLGGVRWGDFAPYLRRRRD